MMNTVSLFKEIELAFFDNEIVKIIDQQNPELWPDILAQSDQTKEKKILFRFLEQLTHTPYNDKEIYRLMLQKTYSFLLKEKGTIQFSEQTQAIYNQAKTILDTIVSLENAQNFYRARVFAKSSSDDDISGKPRPDIDFFLNSTPDSPLCSLPSSPISLSPKVSYTEFGAGIENDGNAGYLISILQALRFISPLVTTIKTEENPNEFMKKMNDFFTLQSSNNNKKECISKEYANAFRTYCLEQGFQQSIFQEKTQQDAQEFYQFLAGVLKIPKTLYRTSTTYNLPPSIPSFNRQKQEKQFTIFLAPTKEKTTIQELLEKSEGQEHLDIETALNTENSSFNEQEKQALANYRGKLVSTKQEIQLYSENIPPFITLAINRHAPRTHQEPFTITPSETISLHTVENVPVFFKLAAVVVHTGATYTSGHYCTYVPLTISGKEVWLEFDDEMVSRYEVPKIEKSSSLYTPYGDVEKNGYLYFYVRQEK